MTISDPDTKNLENLIKRYELAIKNKNKEVRFSVEEMSLIISSLTKLLLYLKNREEKYNKKDQNLNENMFINIDSGYFKK